MKYNHYVYCHKRLDNNEIFYIGKGINKKETHLFYRAYEISRRNNIWKSIISKTKWEYQILFKNLSQDEAFLIEKKLIAKYGKIYNNSGTLANYTDGGEGSVGFFKYSKKQLQSLTKGRDVAKNLPRTNKQMEALGRNALIANPPKNVLQFNLNGNLIEEYISLMEAERKTKILHGNISMCCNNIRKRAGNFIWKFKT